MKEVSEIDQRKTRTLVITADVLGEKMAGPGIRYFHLSRILSQYTDLTLAIYPQDKRALEVIQARLPEATVINFRPGAWELVEEIALQAEVTIVSPFSISTLPQLMELPGALVLDGYDPLVAETLTTITTETLDKQIDHWSPYLAKLYNQYLAADFFICASERQRFWWLGQLEVAGRINPITINDDHSLRNLLDVVPYGLPKRTPEHTKPTVKGIWPGIKEDDVILLWGGGLWPWLDALSAVQATEQLQNKYPQLKLICPGTVHPNQGTANSLPLHKTKAYQYAVEHNLLDSTVFFGGWVPYEDWQNVLLESDIALSLHFDTFETQLAFRSRMLEYFWAGVPVVCTKGDATSDMVADYNVGQVVDYGDVAGVIQAIEDILADSSSYQAGFTRARQELTWANAAEPLVRFCQNPRRAADRRGDYRDDKRLRMTHHERKVTELELLVAAYYNGRFMRFMRELDQIRHRLSNWIARG